MAEELQHLIEQIRKEAVDAGEKQAAELVARAKEKAAAIVREAEAKAAALVEKAEKDARVFTERSQQTLSQAARDLLITVGHGVENIVSDLADEAVEEALTPELMARMIVKMAETYAERGGDTHRTEVLVGEKDQAELVRLFRDRYHHKLTEGLTIHADGKILKGFKVSFQGGRVYHDFTKEAIAESFANLLRPHLSEIVTRAARASQDGARGSER
jgi:V/A-type H+-transporting ATPase subunit E